VMWRPIEERGVDECLRWFLRPDFYFRTKRPHSLSEAAVRRLLDEDGWRYFIAEEGRPVGLGGIASEDRQRTAARVEWRFDSDVGPEQAASGVRGLIEDVAFGVLNFEKAHCYQFGFDDWAGVVYERAGMRREARLRDHVYKSARFFDVIVWGLRRAEAGERR